MVWADHDRMEQVFVNLLNNAFGHNPPGTRVQVTAVAGLGEVAISVIDDGLGMPPELAAAPFEPARRPRTTTTTTTTATTQTTSPPRARDQPRRQQRGQPRDEQREH